MYTYQIVSDTNECVGFKKCWTPFSPLLARAPKDYKEWWGWDLNLGSNKWMISMRYDRRYKKSDYMLWKCYNNTNLSTSQIVLSTVHGVPKMYMFAWGVFSLLNLFTTGGTCG